METPIGQELAGSRAKLAVSAGAAVALVGADLISGAMDQPIRLSVAVTCVALVGWLARWDADSMGLHLRPRQGWRYWIVAALAMGAVVLAFCGAAALVLVALGRPVPVPRLFSAPSEFWPFLLAACVMAPIAEEAAYRLALCIPCTPLMGPWPTIALSGVVFAALHFRYGAASPDNLIAGFLFAWAYLKSGSIVVPVALHALGNLSVGLAALGLLYLG